MKALFGILLLVSLFIFIGVKGSEGKPEPSVFSQQMVDRVQQDAAKAGNDFVEAFSAEGYNGSATQAAVETMKENVKMVAKTLPKLPGQKK